MTPEMKSMVQQAAAALIAAGAREVYLFGSAARGVFDAESDVDIAVAGLPPSIFFKAMGQARRILKRPVDLIDLDESSPFVDYLKNSGGLIRVG